MTKIIDLNTLEELYVQDNKRTIPSDKISEGISSSVNNIIAYDSTLYGKSQILALIRDTRKIYENDLIDKDLSDEKIKELGKKFAVKWAEKIYKIDSNDGKEHSKELYDIYIELKTYRSDIQLKYKTLELALSENIGIKEYKKPIYIYDKGVLKRNQNLKTQVTSFDNQYLIEKEKKLSKEKIENINNEFKKLFEEQYKDFKKIIRNFPTL